MIAASGLEAALGALPAVQRRFLETSGFAAGESEIALLPGEDGALARVAFGLGKAARPFLAGRLAQRLPAGTYRLEGDVGDEALAALGFALGGYRFTRYLPDRDKPRPRLAVSPSVDLSAIRDQAESIALARDLINVPANDLGTAELAAAARRLASEEGASFSLVEGEELEDNFPLIHAVGMGSDRAPCLVDIAYGDESAPKVTLVGKGIVFDTGGLDIKPPSSMLLMKKDMGGAASVLGLARMVMRAGLKVRLRVLLPIAENAISGRAFRPGDVLPSRKGLSVEIGNTDAEGRLVLADALALAEEEKPELIVSMATLTGAARVALGPDLPAFFATDDELAAGMEAAGRAVHDPFWRLPLWPDYDELLSSDIADVSHISSGPYAGAITAALFLKRFVAESAYAHFDVFGWAPKSRPIGPKGGEAQAIRALFAYLEKRYGKG
ncbi:M17 family metallopeptidase [Afifella sp. IM 167]|uniref:leucyl aminopeptidase family protein n=1 Tax=Afifella sp. IM 167 TaxID=2033586 RepID=UPI00351D6FF7|nr:leucyl aminopeptidase [Afifella sp. IM 167]